MKRRLLLKAVAAGCALSPLAAMLAACGRSSTWPEGMAEIKWDRDTCARCSMAISNRRFAVEARGGPTAQHYKFDDIGCAIVWLNNQAWGNDAATRLWVADSAGNGERWLDARQARYVGGFTSPMGYGYGATSQPQQAASLGFDELRQQLLAQGKRP